MDKEFLEGLGMDAQAVEAVLEAHGKVVQAHQTQLAAMQLQQQVSEAVHKAGGRNIKAISALLDLQAIGSSENVAEALETAMAALKQENSYLFLPAMPPQYAKFTGSQDVPQKVSSLAGALRERMRKK